MVELKEVVNRPLPFSWFFSYWCQWTEKYNTFAPRTNLFFDKLKKFSFWDNTFFCVDYLQVQNWTFWISIKTSTLRPLPLFLRKNINLEGWKKLTTINGFCFQHFILKFQMEKKMWYLELNCRNSSTVSWRCILGAYLSLSLTHLDTKGLNLWCKRFACLHKNG